MTPNKFDISVIFALAAGLCSLACDKTAPAVQSDAPTAPTPPSVAPVANPQPAAPVSPAVPGVLEHSMQPGMKMGPGMVGHDRESDGGHGGMHGGHGGPHGGHGGTHS